MSASAALGLRHAALVAVAATAACAGRGVPAATDAPAGFRVDAAFEEWDDVPIVATNGREVQGPDLTEVRALADAEALRLLLTFERPLNLQSMEGMLRLAVDGDGDAATGERVAALAGADVIVDFSVLSEQGGGSGVGLRLAGDSTPRTVYDAGLAYAPTHASARFEVEIARLPLLPGRTLRALLVMLDDRGGPVEVFGPFELAAPPAQPLAPADRTIPLARPVEADLRVLVWNVGDATPLRAPEPFRRVLAAAAPDVVLLDEINPRLDAAAVRELLPRDGDWTVVLGDAGGRQRTAVAARLPLQASRRLARVEWPDSARALLELPMLPQVRQDLEGADRDGLPATGAVATVGALRVLFVPLDLACCGRTGSSEDRARVIAARALREAIAEALASGEADAVVVGGDLNLVGSRTPLEMLGADLDAAGGDLRTAHLTTPDRRTFSTWRAPSPFPPGRLDWVLFTGSVLEQVGGMVLDATLLDPTERAVAGLQASDAEVTDHLPLVVDFRVRRP